MAARLTKISDHVTPILEELATSSATHSFKYCLILVYMYTIIHGKAPAYLTNVVQPYTPKRVLRLSHQQALLTPMRARTNWGD